MPGGHLLRGLSISNVRPDASTSRARTTRAKSPMYDMARHPMDQAVRPHATRVVKRKTAGKRGGARVLVSSRDDGREQETEMGDNIIVASRKRAKPYKSLPAADQVSLELAEKPDNPNMRLGTQMRPDTYPQHHSPRAQDPPVPPRSQGVHRGEHAIVPVDAVNAVQADRVEQARPESDSSNNANGASEDEDDDINALVSAALSPLPAAPPKAHAGADPQETGQLTFSDFLYLDGGQGYGL